ncbi:uncharacterized protein [Physcomitrium patens]|uniref:CHAT domain-containing protein n=1 Tax=Physcomitrium patens TaxID=3218 RepID=A0A2K1L3H6_PHYPA|nr:uncharacterized protein LOC112295735 [Physcomitrium patens]PNR60584.1 hypothetical protein PHYPA_003377 [Physcomitrium patens]|eukprot:XP_024403410.1 uncharacterized protein LOC112295735 [Physcomitrella patens]
MAGNPMPMGLGCNQLPGAEKEAKDVARLFRIKPCVGTDMTKQAVLGEYSKQKRVEETPQILTAGEITGLEGDISAGLVVLSACESGLGESTSGEGLLGLGRALLQAGGVTAILTLWKVNDTFTCDFVTKLFKELLSVESEGRSVSECMRTVVLFMIRHNHPVKHWAPFTIMGSPTLQLFKPEKSLSFSGLHGCSTPISMHLDYSAMLR